MRKILFAAALAVLSAPALAQESAGCFWIAPDGRFASLSQLCPTAPTAPATAAASEDLRPIAYADAYCRARTDGFPVEAARARGVSAMQAVADGRPVDDATIRAALAKVGELCPRR